MYPALNLGSPVLFTRAQSKGLHPGASATFCRFLTAGFGFLVVVGGVCNVVAGDEETTREL